MCQTLSLVLLTEGEIHICTSYIHNFLSQVIIIELYEKKMYVFLFGSTWSILIIRTSIIISSSLSQALRCGLEVEHSFGMFKALNLTYSTERTGYLNPDD